jgi:hypothetical protein
LLLSGYNTQITLKLAQRISQERGKVAHRNMRLAMKKELTEK